jgi:hypothetical protein
MEVITGLVFYIIYYFHGMSSVKSKIHFNIIVFYILVFMILGQKNTFAKLVKI